MKSKRGPLAFSKSERLRKNPEFARVQKQGRRYQSKNFIIVIAASSNIEKRRSRTNSRELKTPRESVNTTDTKLGITITKKVESSAVKRNRVKRIVREAFRQFKDKCNSGISILVISKGGAMSLNASEVNREIFNVLKDHGFAK